MPREVIEQHSRGFLCVNAHPEGCFRNVERQIELLKARAVRGVEGPANVLVIGSSTGYGLASRIAAAWGFQANTLGICLERPPRGKQTASAGFYNTVAFHRQARADGLFAASLLGDAFSDDLKRSALETIRREMGPMGLVIYSLAAPKRTHPHTGRVQHSALKPIGAPFAAKTIDLDSEEVISTSIPAASEKEIADTISVMGGDNWRMWIMALLENNLLARGARTVAYSYIGPEYSWPIYRDGTIGRAKQHLAGCARELNAMLGRHLGGNAYISVNQAIVTQASVAIPIVPLYLSLLLRSMRREGTAESPVEHIWRLFRDHLAPGNVPELDLQHRIRLDHPELRPQVQERIANLWPQITTDNLHQLTDFAEFKRRFCNLFGFEVEKVDYRQPAELAWDWEPAMPLP